MNSVLETGHLVQVWEDISQDFPVKVEPCESRETFTRAFIVENGGDLLDKMTKAEEAFRLAQQQVWEEAKKRNIAISPFEKGGSRYKP